MLFGKVTEELYLHAQYLTKSNLLKSMKSDLSDDDKEILRKFQAKFKDYLSQIGFNSFEMDALIIDDYTFQPRVRIKNANTIKLMRADFGSSASDWIRIIIAYTLALHVCRKHSRRTQHPNISVFDEPMQQNMDRADYLKIFDIVAEVCKQGGQVIIAATDKDHEARQRAQKLGMEIHDFKDSFVLQ